MTKRFGGLVAVNGVDLRVEEKETVGIIGPNGSGKTTLFNLITGLFQPTAGQIVFMDRDVTSARPEQRVAAGMVRTFQLVSVFNSLRVWENLVLCVTRFDAAHSSIWKFMTSPATGGTIRDDCYGVLRLVGLEDKAGTMTSELSYGDKRLLEIAIALSLKPKLLLLDEPLSGLSDVEVVDILNLLRRIKRDVTIIIIEHKVSMIVDFVDRLCVMNEGRFVSEGEPSEVLRDPAVQKCYWGKEGTRGC
ncbi:MAG TPA: ATP-binding cassette domain-containing protein [Firmicutes bacterium]|nr:ATP-binding cassette domain-containing protein [Bacillota bacterium]